MDIMARLESANHTQQPIIIDDTHKEQLQGEQAARMEGQDPLSSNVLYKQYSAGERGTRVRSKRTIQVAITTVIEEEESNEATPKSCNNRLYKAKGTAEPDPYASVNDVFDMVAKR